MKISLFFTSHKISQEQHLQLSIFFLLTYIYINKKLFRENNNIVVTFLRTLQKQYFKVGEVGISMIFVKKTIALECTSDVPV